MEEKTERIFNKLTTQEIVDEILQTKELIERLWYLEQTGRYREWAGYETKTFDDFLKEVIGISPIRYKEATITFGYKAA